MLDLNGGSGVISDNVAAPFVSATGTLNMVSIGSGAGPYTVSGNAPNGWVTYVFGSGGAAASTITLPSVFGDGMPIYDVSGTATITGMTYAILGVGTAVSGAVITLSFAAVATVASGTYRHGSGVSAERPDELHHGGRIKPDRAVEPRRQLG